MGTALPEAIGDGLGELAVLKPVAEYSQGSVGDGGDRPALEVPAVDDAVA